MRRSTSAAVVPGQSPSSEPSDVRETMRAVPLVPQALLTRLTGKPLAGEEPPFRETPETHLFEALCRVFGGALLTTLLVFILLHPGLWSLPAALLVPALATLGHGIPLGWIIQTGGARKLHTTVVHYIAHRTYGNDVQKADRVGELCTACVVVQPLTLYRHDHVDIHHTRSLATPVDPDCRVLLWLLAFVPGKTVQEYWTTLRHAFLSPRVQIAMLRGRVYDNFLNPATPPARRRLAALIQGGILGGVGLACWVTGGVLPFWLYLAGWFFPLGVLLNVSAIGQFLTEHSWMLPNPTPDGPYRTHLRRLTVDRFCGEPYPAAGPAWLRLRWYLRMLYIHIPCRLFFLPGTLVVHAFHHLHAAYRNWPNEIYDRQRLLETGEDLPAVWGMRAALDRVFRLLSELPPLPPGAAALTPEELDAAIRAM